ncbi:MAG: hypothetical protein SFU86_19785 [Pirellulaceae bacterium]|nr:hypothetical protein [Pirellulaceae bacterium]
MSHEYRTVYEILDALRVRPALFLGNLHRRHPFATLLAFLDGLSFADIDPGTPPIWLFSRWITARVDGISTNLPWDWLEEQLGGDGAYAAYFQYLDEYRACLEVEVARPEGVELVPRFWRVDSKGCQVSPPIPERLYVGQWAPSEVFFLTEVYGASVERCFPYHRSVEGVVEEAQSRWSVPASAW